MQSLRWKFGSKNSSSGFLGFGAFLTLLLSLYFVKLTRNVWSALAGTTLRATADNALELTRPLITSYFTCSSTKKKKKIKKISRRWLSAQLPS